MHSTSSKIRRFWERVEGAWDISVGSGGVGVDSDVGQ